MPSSRDDDGTFTAAEIALKDNLHFNHCPNLAFYFIMSMHMEHFDIFCRTGGQLNVIVVHHIVAYSIEVDTTSLCMNTISPFDPLHFSQFTGPLHL